MVKEASKSWLLNDTNFVSRGSKDGFSTIKQINAVYMSKILFAVV
jgi:hypothetical protein